MRRISGLTEELTALRKGSCVRSCLEIEISSIRRTQQNRSDKTTLPEDRSRTSCRNKLLI